MLFETGAGVGVAVGSGVSVGIGDVATEVEVSDELVSYDAVSELPNTVLAEGDGLSEGDGFVRVGVCKEEARDLFVVPIVALAAFWAVFAEIKKYPR